jgi:hypothetical protein
MLSTDTFLTGLYCLIDDFCKLRPISFEESNVWDCGRKRSLTRSEVITLSIYGQLARFQSERDFWRYCEQRLTHLFPSLTDRAEFVRAQMRFQPTTEAFALHLGQVLTPGGAKYEVIDRCGVATRTVGRRGRDWLGGYANRGYCGRLGFFHGLQLMCVVTDSAVITGYGIGAGSAKDQPMAHSLFAARHTKNPRLPSRGATTGGGYYVVDRGFSGAKPRRFWATQLGAHVVGPQQKGHGPSWPREWAKWAAGLRQIVETVHDRLVNFFRLGRERPHRIEGFKARLAAKIALHNVLIWFNRQHDRPALQFADLIAW